MNEHKCRFKVWNDAVNSSNTYNGHPLYEKNLNCELCGKVYNVKYMAKE